MKKIIISVLATMCVMAIMCVGVIQNITAQHEAELRDTNYAHETLVMELREGYREALEENYELEIHVDELEDGFYSMMNDDEFDVTINHDDARYQYVCEKDGWFKNIRTVKTVGLDN